MKPIYTLLISIAALLFAACSEERIIDGDNQCIVGEERLVDLPFGNTCFDDITINSRATNDGLFEHVAQNMYVLMFNTTTGKKVYGKYFDVMQRMNTREEVAAAHDCCWWIEPATFNGKDQNSHDKLQAHSHGVIRMKTPTGGPFKIYVLANIEAEYLNISSELFDGIDTENELINYTLKLKGRPQVRTSMCMLGSIDNVNIIPRGVDEADIMTNNVPVGGTNALKLNRVDARVEFQIFINPEKNNRLKAFVPKTWEIVNIPKTTKLIESSANTYHPQGLKDDKGEEMFFNTIPYNFEKTFPHPSIKHVDGTSVDVSQFSFYMLENHPSVNGKSTISTYQEREKRRKTADGKYDESEENIWTNAPLTGTYVVLKGQVEMLDPDPNTITGGDRTLFADVTYYIHLGDFGPGKYDNFDISRNTRYTYKVSIEGVNSIKTEVETSQTGEVEELQPGAAGDVFVAEEKVQIFDAHYGQMVIRIDKQYINEKLTWYVETPFTQGARPEDSSGSTIAAGLDYKWVRFFRNIVNDDDTYSKKNRWYPGNTYKPKSGKMGDKLMYVDELVKYLQQQKRMADSNQPNDFRQETITLTNGATQVRDVIYLTVFIDEYYYDKNPITGETDGFLWQRFVNDCGDRMMHILCDSRESLDGESTVTNSVATIRQKPIQTPYTAKVKCYNEIGNPITAWGCETVDESGFDFITGDGGLTFDTQGLNTGYGSNYSSSNGLYNSYKLANLGKYDWKTFFDATSNSSKYITDDPKCPTLRWELGEDYDEITKPSGTLRNNIHFLRHSYHNLRYTFLLRNRDNNGDGYIQDNEVRWYIASINQLTSLFLGGEGISGDAQLYPDIISSLNEPYNQGVFRGCMKWRHHVVSSTIDTNVPKILWAEEGLSVSKYSEDDGWGKSASKSIRCIRNIGKNSWNPNDEKDFPDPLLEISGLTVDASRINRRSLRGGGAIDPNLRSLGTMDEDRTFALLPLGFEVKNEVLDASNIGLTKAELEEFQKAVQKANPTLFTSPKDVQPYDVLKYIYDNGLVHYYPKPNTNDGKTWRMPNVRELAVIANSIMPLVSSLNTTDVISSTYFSHGFYGDGYADIKSDGTLEPMKQRQRCWFAKQGHMALNNSGDYRIIFVRDWQPK